MRAAETDRPYLRSTADLSLIDIPSPGSAIGTHTEVNIAVTV
jgi:hypothetical protein